MTSAPATLYPLLVTTTFGNSLAATWRALSHPRRAVPIALVGAALVGTEVAASRSPAAAINLAAFITLFTLLAPAAWRWSRMGRGGGSRYALYLALCVGLVALSALLLPRALGFESYVLHAPAAVALMALCAIAGHVLGRDIELEVDLERAEDRGERLLRAAEDARLLALRRHLDPHFLFNTLGAIAEWCREDPEVAERALLGLSDILRTLFAGIGEREWPLSREMEVLVAVHRLYELRDDERYSLEVELGEAPRDARIPPLVLLPLFENGLTHGAGGAPTLLRVFDEGASVDVEMWSAGEFGGEREGGTGIETAAQRLRLAYGDRGQLQIDEVARGGILGTRVRVSFPASRESQE